MILSYSSGLFALWSTERSKALLFLQRIALESPMFAQYNLSPIINTITAVEPHYLACFGYVYSYYLSIISNDLYKQFLIVWFRSLDASIPVSTSSS